MQKKDTVRGTITGVLVVLVLALGASAIHADEERATSHRKRKIMTPTKRGTINRATIRRVIKEVIANRPASNEN